MVRPTAAEESDQVIRRHLAAMVVIAQEGAWTGRPADPPPYLGPMGLYVAIPGQEIRIVYRQDQLEKLATILGQISDKVIDC